MASSNALQNKMSASVASRSTVGAGAGASTTAGAGVGTSVAGGAAGAEVVRAPYPLEATTVQASAFRTMVEAIKDILTEAGIIFDASGMKIMSMDESHTVLVHLRLPASKFTSYRCTRTFMLGVNMLYLFKLVKTMETDDVLTIYMDDSNPNELHLKMQNNKKKQTTIQQLKLIHYEWEDLEVEDIKAKTIIAMQSSEFQKLCRDMNAIGRILDIKSVGSQIEFSCEGDFAKSKRVVQANNDKDGMKVVEQTSEREVIQGRYALRHLILFCKCTSLCPTVQIHLASDYPAVLNYAIADLGEIKLCLAPTTAT